MQASPARTDGPIYDLPEGIGQEIVCDERNREYLLLTTEQGGVFLMPYLDKDGDASRERKEAAPYGAASSIRRAIRTPA